MNGDFELFVNKEVLLEVIRFPLAIKMYNV
jgi:hypothetical protein